MDRNVEESLGYLTTGGLGEVMGLADMARSLNQPKVQMDTDMAIALCALAQDGIEAKKAA